MASYGDLPPLPAADMLRYAQAAGFTRAEAIDVLRISWRESGWRPDAHRTEADRTRLLGDLGLMQINYTNDTEANRQAVGYTSRSQWFDPAINMRMARRLYETGGGFKQGWGADAGGWTNAGDPFYNTPTREDVETAIAEGTTPAGGEGGGGGNWISDVAGAGLGPIGGILLGGGDAVKKLAQIAGAFIATITSPTWWRRVGIGALGVAIILGSVIMAIASR